MNRNREEVIINLRRQYRSAYRVAKETGLNKSTVTRFFNYETTQCSPNTALLLARLLANDEAEQNEIIRALIDK